MMSQGEEKSIDGYECSCGREFPVGRPPRHCPHCHAMVYPFRKYLVQWDDGNKTYDVKLNLPGRRHTSDEEAFILELPYLIAVHSSCSCGGPLTLGSHVIRKSNECFELEAKYVCLKCKKAESKSLIARLRRAIEKIWNETTKLEVGPTGVRYEKKDSSKSKQ
jgi:hypothetical protein